MLKKEINNPKIKVTGIDNQTKINLAELKLDLNARNFSNLDSTAKALYMNTNQESENITMILKVSAEIYLTIKKKQK